MIKQSLPEGKQSLSMPCESRAGYGLREDMYHTESLQNALEDIDSLLASS
jgi:hypothetical protein